MERGLRFGKRARIKFPALALAACSAAAKAKNPESPAVRRDALEDWGRKRRW